MRRRGTVVLRLLNRLAAAVRAGGELRALIEAIREGERRREDLQARLRAVSELPAVDGRRLEQELLDELREWRSLLADDVQAARPVLQQLLVERLEFKPLEEGIRVPCEFTGKAYFGGLLTGLVGVRIGWRRQRR